MLENRISFEEARFNAPLRQAYFNSLLPILPDSISKIIYDPETTHSQKQVEKMYSQNRLSKDEKNFYLGEIADQLHTCATVIVGIRTLGMGGKHPVFAFNCAFDEFKSENQMISVMIDHEGAHANQNRNGLTLPDFVKLNSYEWIDLGAQGLSFALEHEAYNYQLAKFKERKYEDFPFESYIQSKIFLNEALLRQAISSRENK